MNGLLTDPASTHFPLPPDDGHPCGHDCAFAQTIRSDPFADEWLWCTHPARATRVVNPGRPCPRYQPTAKLTGARFDDLISRAGR